MKKTMKRALAIIIAAVMLLGAAAIAAAANTPKAELPTPWTQKASKVPASVIADWQAGKGTARGVISDEEASVAAIPGPGVVRMSIKQLPDMRQYLIGFEKPDLSGLIINAETGGKKFEASWDQGYGWFYSGSMEYYWSLSADESEFPSLPAAAANVPVHFYGESYDWNTYKYETYSGVLNVPFEVLSLLSQMDQPSGELFLDIALDTALVSSDDAFSPNFYSFTPSASGFYMLTASNFPATTTVFGVLLSDAGAAIGKSSSDLAKNPLVCSLEAGQTYYYAVDYVYEKAPVAPPYELTLLVKKYIPTALRTDAGTELSVKPNDNVDKIFSFTPSKTGDYTFSSYAGGNIDLTGELLDSTMKTLKKNDDGYTEIYVNGYQVSYIGYGLDFKITYRLTAGQTYFLRVGNIDGYFYNYGSENITAMIYVDEAYLTAAGGTTKMYYNDYLSPGNLFYTSYDAIDITLDGAYFTEYWWWGEYMAAKVGTTSAKATALDEKGDKTDVTAAANVKITYTFMQWLLVIFLFGWLWM